MNRDTETVPARHETPDLAELRRLAEAATPGPWEAFGAVDGRRGERWLGVTTDMRATEAARAGDVFAAQNCTRQDALFIAAANPAAVLALLAERDALAAAAERARVLATEWATQPTDYDEDTEQQIEDGNAIVRALDATPETGCES